MENFSKKGKLESPSGRGRLRSQAVTCTGLHTIRGIRYVWIESKPMVPVGIEERVEIKVL